MKTRILLVALSVTAAYAAPGSAPQVRLSPLEVDALQAHAAGPGTSGIAGISTTVVAGDPTRPGLYTIRLSVPANTRIQAHTHRDERSAVVVAGTWYFGYGTKADESAVKALPAGSFYTEPANVAHFALTRDSAVQVYITGVGPTDTVYMKAGDQPK